MWCNILLEHKTIVEVIGIWYNINDHIYLKKNVVMERTKRSIDLARQYRLQKRTLLTFLFTLQIDAPFSPKAAYR